MTPYWSRGQRGAVYYYQCIKNQKEGRKCPVKRVNAKNLHGELVRRVSEAASSPEFLTDSIATAIAALPSIENRAEISSL
jgi:hypothetical protein